MKDSRKFVLSSRNKKKVTDRLDQAICLNDDPIKYLIKVDNLLSVVDNLVVVSIHNNKLILQ